MASGVQIQKMMLMIDLKCLNGKVDICIIVYYLMKVRKQLHLIRHEVKADQGNNSRSYVRATVKTKSSMQVKV